MSIASISNDIISYDPKSLKHLESSENFQAFLTNSAYTTRVKPSHHPKQKPYFQKAEFISPFDECFEVLDPKKRPVTSREPNVMVPRSTRNEEPAVDSIFFDVSEIPGPCVSYFKMGGRDNYNSTPLEDHGKSGKKGSGLPLVYNRGFEIPKEVSMDKETRQYIESLHSRIMGMEREVMRLKKENYGLKDENRKMQEKMVAVTNEQVRIEKKKEGYERTIVGLRENCQNNQQMVDSLKEILTMQEGEFYDKIARKQKELEQIPETVVEKVKPSLQSISTRKTRNSIRINSKYPRSATSIESIWEIPKEKGEKSQQKKVIVRVNTPRTASTTSSMSSLQLKKTVSVKEPMKGENRGVRIE